VQRDPGITVKTAAVAAAPIAAATVRPVTVAAPAPATVAIRPQVSNPVTF